MNEQRLDHLEKMLAQLLEEVKKVNDSLQEAKEEVNEGIGQLEEIINHSHQESMALIDVLAMRTTQQEAALAQLKGRPKVKP